MTSDFESSAASNSSGIYRIGRFCRQRKLTVHWARFFISSIHCELPPNLADLVDGCLGKNPSDRFASGEEMAAASFRWPHFA